MEKMSQFVNQLGDEMNLLSRLLYKNKNQHRHTKHFQSLKQVS